MSTPAAAFSEAPPWCLQGGANAGHTIYDSSGKKYALHLVPSGILSKSALCVVGNGVVIHLPTLFEEIETLEAQGVSTERLIISERAHLLFDLHKVWQRPTFSAVKGWVLIVLLKSARGKLCKSLTSGRSCKCCSLQR